ncbi:MAG: hypothetical protein HQ567_13250 [Candidatus Nealsonbacteria bacterium]|nr:hypothetical protein [Candidatus Nealsonbacteria bacterium]
MRRLLIVLLGILVSVTILLIVLATYPGTAQQDAGARPEELPDLSRFDSEDEKRSSLIGAARRQLECITQKHDNMFNSLLVRGNCEVVETRLEEDYDDANAAPMLIVSSLVPLVDEKECFFFIWGFNPHREHDAIVLLGKTREGTTVRIRYELMRRVKSGALVGMFGDKTRLVSLDELLQAGKVSPSNGEIEVRISTKSADAVPMVPDLPVLAVAVHDSNGKLSNFVPVCRGK